MEPIAIGIVQNIKTGKNCITFYENEKAEISDQLLKRVYDSRGINIPPTKSGNYPVLKDRLWKRIYPDDGEFHQAFLEIELPRLEPTFKYVKC